VQLSATRRAEKNCVQGTVTRQIYLGSHRVYLVTLADGETVRAVAPSGLSIAPGASVWLHLPPEHCRALAH
jgi:iron(III) transport system ATP-binding protein